MTYKIIPQLSQTQIANFHKRVNKTSNIDECWIWIGYKDKKGYGQVGFNNKVYLCHRISYFLFYNVDPKDLMVCHSCDNPSCCNPNHFFLGSALDNVNDAIIKNRRYNKGFKLNAVDVVQIKTLIEQGLSRRKIAKIFNVQHPAIDNIANGKSWKHITL